MSEQEQEVQIDPETGEVLDSPDDAEAAEEAEAEQSEPAEDDAQDSADAERERELAAERQQVEQAQQAEEAAIEKNTKALNRAADTYIKKVVDTLGEGLEGMETCPLCAETWPGLRFPVMPSPENLARVRVAIGLEPGDNLRSDNYSRTCDDCEGWGFTDSGSKVPGQTKLTCYRCGGRGWVPVGTEREGGSVTGEPGGNVVPMPALQDNPSNDPPEVDRLKQLGYIVVAPAPPVEVPNA